tara:strand:+ start:183 stop:671 length:489 start_codon:yes stop_codon:yes gene_type:complete
MRSSGFVQHRSGNFGVIEVRSPIYSSPGLRIRRDTMLKKTLIAVSALTMATFAVAPAAQADGFYFGFYGNSGGGYSSGGHYSGGSGSYYTPRHQHATPPRVERVMTQNQIRRELRQRGFSDFRRIDRRGRVYVVVAEARRGQLVRLRVNAYNGRIESRTRIS